MPMVQPAPAVAAPAPKPRTRRRPRPAAVPATFAADAAVVSGFGAGLQIAAAPSGLYTASGAPLPAGAATVAAAPAAIAPMRFLSTSAVQQTYAAAKERASMADVYVEVPQRVEAGAAATPLPSAAEQAEIFSHLSNLVAEADGAGAPLTGRRLQQQQRRRQQSQRRARSLLQTTLLPAAQPAPTGQQLTVAQQQQSLASALFGAMGSPFGSSFAPAPARSALPPPPAAPSAITLSTPVAGTPAGVAPAAPAAANAANAPQNAASAAAQLAPVSAAAALNKLNAAVVKVVNLQQGVVNAVNSVNVPNERGQPQGQLLQDLTFIENDQLSVGVDVARGGVVGQISSMQMPAPFTGKNLINVWDCGRLMQQSYYGCDDGSCWAAKAWRWNPGAAGFRGPLAVGGRGSGSSSRTLA